MIRAKILADSVNPAGQRITTFLITYPRMVLAEINTHRMLSRNSASSRAIPIHRMLRDILREPARPVSWGQNGKGMQAKAELPRCKQLVANLLWTLACWCACGFSWLLSRVGVHKQLANRVTEPWAHMTTVVTATEWGNFFSLRCHKDAQPEFQELAYAMLAEYLASEPRRLQWGEWHIPFGDAYLGEPGLSLACLLKIATARCARTSYLNFTGDIEHAKDYQLHDDLLANGHMSPFEHAACAYDVDDGLGRPPEVDGRLLLPQGCGNYRGFAPYRKFLPNENRTPSRDDLQKLLSERTQRA
jgi:hypothetical protein